MTKRKKKKSYVQLSLLRIAHTGILFTIVLCWQRNRAETPWPRLILSCCLPCPLIFLAPQTGLGEFSLELGLVLSHCLELSSPLSCLKPLNLLRASPPLVKDLTVLCTIESPLQDRTLPGGCRGELYRSS